MRDDSLFRVKKEGLARLGCARVARRDIESGENRRDHHFDKPHGLGGFCRLERRESTPSVFPVVTKQVSTWGRPGVGKLVLLEPVFTVEVVAGHFFFCKSCFPTVHGELFLNETPEGSIQQDFFLEDGPEAGKFGQG